MPDIGDPLRHDIERYYHVVAPFLPRELASRGDEDFWLAVASERAPRRALELGAGTCRISALLAARVPRVVALDLSSDLLRIARDRAASHGNLRLVHGDMRRLPFASVFDLVLAANDPFSHLTRDSDRELSLVAAARALRPGGRFILDALWFPERAWRRMASPQGRHVVRELGQLDGSPLRVSELWRRDGRACRCRARYEYVLRDAVVARAAFRARAWSMSEIRARFDRAGLVLFARWGSYRRHPWNARLSSRLIVEAQRM